MYRNCLRLRTERLLAVKGEDYAFAQPSLVAHKRRKLELRAGLPATRGRKGTASGYSLKAVRVAERRLAEQAEHAYRTLTAGWQPNPPARQPAAHTAARRREWTWSPPPGRD
jgi:hypothetical protein